MYPQERHAPNMAAMIFTMEWKCPVTHSNAHLFLEALRSEHILTVDYGCDNGHGCMFRGTDGSVHVANSVDEPTIAFHAFANPDDARRILAQAERDWPEESLIDAITMGSEHHAGIDTLLRAEQSGRFHPLFTLCTHNDFDEE